MANLIKTKGYKYWWWYIAETSVKTTPEDNAAERSFMITFNWLRKGREITLGTAKGRWSWKKRKTFSKYFAGQKIKIKLIDMDTGKIEDSQIVTLDGKA